MPIIVCLSVLGYFNGHGYLRETNANPAMDGTVILQTSDAANSSNKVYTAIKIVAPTVGGLGRQCYWLVPIRPVYGTNASVGSITSDNSRDGVFDVYDISGRAVITGVTYGDACGKLPSGIYIFAGRDGRRIKVSL